MLEFLHVGFAYSNQPVLRDASFQLSEGALTALLSPNAGGKSTLLRLAAGLLKPAQGKIVPQFSCAKAARHIAFLPQSRPVPDITVWDLAAHGRYPWLSRRHILTRGDRAIVEEALRQCGCWNLRDRRLTALSGGQRQKAYLALALAQNTPVLLLDEPTAAFDIKVQLEIMAMLRAQTRQGKTVLLAIHDIPLALRFCDDILVLHEGTLFGRDLLEQAFGVPFDERGNALWPGMPTEKTAPPPWAKRGI